MSNYDPFMDEKKPSYKFDTYGQTLVGTLDSYDQVQDRDFATKEPKVYRDTGKPVMVTVAEITTDGGDTWAVWMRGDLFYRAREAIQAAHKVKPFPLNEEGKASPIGGRISITYTGEEPSGKGNPKKLFEVKFKSPEPPAVTADDF